MCESACVWAMSPDSNKWLIDWLINNLLKICWKIKLMVSKDFKIINDKFRFVCNRNSTCIRRLCKRSFIQFPLRRLTTLSFGARRRQRTVSSAKACCGALPDKEFAVLNVESRRMKNAKICSMLIAFNVRALAQFFLFFLSILIAACMQYSLQ